MKPNNTFQSPLPPAKRVTLITVQRGLCLIRTIRFVCWLTLPGPPLPPQGSGPGPVGAPWDPMAGWSGHRLRRQSGSCWIAGPASARQSTARATPAQRSAGRRVTC